MDHAYTPRPGWIEVITGSMFSGKSEELIRRLRRAQIAKQKVQIFKPATSWLNSRLGWLMYNVSTGSVWAIEHVLKAVTPQLKSTFGAIIDAVTDNGDDLLKQVEAPLQKYTANRGGPRGSSIARAAGGITADPPACFHAIRIIVEHGNVTLMGVVNNDADMAIAGMRANIVPGVFSVDNNLQVAGEMKKSAELR